MHTATLLLLVLAAGLASQWLAWRIRLPAIIVLIAVGIVLGPVSGVVSFASQPGELAELIGLGVAIILFEGGMDLRIGEFRRVGRGIGHLTLLGAPISWLLGSWAAHTIAGLSWPVASVLGAILVVTGPTVILPLLRQSRLNKETASLLKWEGIVNDPIGVLLAVLTFQYFTVGSAGFIHPLSGFGRAVAAALLLGGGGGWGIGWFYRRGWVPEQLKAPILMVLVLVVYWASNLAQHEAGLLSVTLMGMVIGNLKLVERETLQRFEEHLSIVLLSVLFIIIPTQLKGYHLDQLNWRVYLFVLAILFLVRPLTIGLATLGGPLRRQDKWLLAWIAPRGIVAVATAAVLGPALVAAGYPDAVQLLPIVFLVILTTVLVHGLTIAPLARRLGLAAKQENGMLIIGAFPFTIALAQVMKQLEIEVLLVDGAYHRLKEARMGGIDVYYGEFLSERTEETLETQHLGYLLCATDNDFYNALVCKAQGRRFGSHRAFQLVTHQETTPEAKRMPLGQRGHFAFGPTADFETLHQRMDEGWTVQTVRLNERRDFSRVEQNLGIRDRDWFLLGALTPKGVFRLYSAEQPFKPETGWTLLVFSSKLPWLDPKSNDVPQEDRERALAPTKVHNGE